MASYAALYATNSEHGGERPLSQERGSRGRGKSKQGGVGGNASWISSVINLLNTIVGAGVLAMPHALSNMGILLGVLIILWSALASGFGLYLQTRCARYLDRGASSFFALSQITYPNAAIFFDGAIAIKCFGVAISYLIIIGDLMPGVVRGFTHRDALGAAEFLLDRQFWITAFMLIVIPLSFLRRLDSLKYTSSIALFSIAYLVVLVVYHYASGDTVDSKGEIHWLKWQGPIPTLASFPVMVFAYTCHQNMFSILNEIHDNSHFRTTSVVVASNSLSASIYILVAVTGYLSFGTNTMGNIVSQYFPSVFSTIGRAAIVVLVMFSYPLQVHPCRASLDAVSKWRPVRTKSRQARPGEEFTPASGSPSRSSLLPQKSLVVRPKPEDMSELRFAIITTAIVILTYTVAMAVSSLDRVLAYVGSTGSTAISFILPGLFYYKISSPDSPHHQRLLKDEDDNDEYEGSSGSDDDRRRSSPRPMSWRNKVRGRQCGRDLLRKGGLALALYGVVVMVVSFTTTTFFIVSS